MSKVIAISVIFIALPVFRLSFFFINAITYKMKAEWKHNNQNFKTNNESDNKIRTIHKTVYWKPRQQMSNRKIENSCWCN